jgi:hypothetical protein
MKVQFDHTLQSSFYLWFDDRLTRVAEGVSADIGMNFDYYAETNDVPTSLDAYYGPYRQLVSNGTGVPTGVYLNGVFTPQSNDPSSWMLIDHNQGRVILDPNIYGSNLTVSGDFQTKDFNVYITNDTEEELLLEGTFLLPDDKTQLENVGNLNVDHYVVPAAFITLSNSRNKPFAMGGLDQTIVDVRVVALADSNYKLDAILSHFRDTKNIGAYMIPYQDFPFGEFFHIKNPPYSYPDLIASRQPNIWIENVRTSKLYDRNSVLRLSKDLNVGFIDFELNTVRDPRIYS